MAHFCARCHREKTTSFVSHKDSPITNHGSRQGWQYHSLAGPLSHDTTLNIHSSSSQVFHTWQPRGEENDKNLTPWFVTIEKFKKHIWLLRWLIIKRWTWEISLSILNLFQKSNLDVWWIMSKLSLDANIGARKMHQVHWTRSEFLTEIDYRIIIIIIFFFFLHRTNLDVSILSNLKSNGWSNFDFDW